ncbi:MAG: hypothetical protein JXN64_04140 [Spirochaetes bacterium]|nr:hypothetical protein [Spirochaetota bacterium]
MTFSIVINFIVIFIAGFVVDLLSTKYTRYIVTKKIAKATLLSGIITVVNFALLTILLKDNVSEGIYNILAFAGGNSMGTLLAMKRV